MIVRMKKIVSLVLFVTLCMSFCITGSATEYVSTVDASVSSVYRNVVVKGQLDDTDPNQMVTLMLLASDANASAPTNEDIKHIAMCQPATDGSYYYKFKTNANISNCKLLVKLGSENVTDSVAVAEATVEPMSINLALENADGGKLHIGRDSVAKLRITAENRYANAESCKLILAAYGGGMLLDCNIIGDVIDFCADGEKYRNLSEEFVIPDGTDSVKGYIWDDTVDIIPLDKLVEKNKANSLGLTQVQAGKDITVAFIGGSITNGTGSSQPSPATGEYGSKRRYADVVIEDYFEKHYENVTYYNAGIGGTPSRYGAFRLEKDIISKEPDVVFVEFAVNDKLMTDEESISYMESIVKKLMNAPKQPVIIFLYSACYREGYPCKTLTGLDSFIPKTVAHQAVADKYGIGSVNFADYVDSIIGTETCPFWDSWWSDHSHPSSIGHDAYGAYIIKALEDAPQDYFKLNTENKTALSSVLYENAHLVPVDGNPDMKITGEYHTGVLSGVLDNWMFNYPYSEDGILRLAPGSSITFTFIGDSIGACGPRVSGDYSTINGTYSIDGGKYIGTANNTGSHASTMSFFVTGLEYGEHTITITADESDNVNQFYALSYFMVN